MKWEEEIELIIQYAIRYGVDPYFLAAIRRAENGQPGREFGILSVATVNYREELEVACKTVRNKLFMYSRSPFVTLLSGHLDFKQEKSKRLCYSPEFIRYIGKSWAPINAENDPNDLNTNWIKNVYIWYTHFVENGLDEV